VSFDPPRDGPPSAKPPHGKQPRATLSLMLVDVQESTAAGSHAWSSQRAEDGQVMGRVPPNRSYRFTYLMTAAAEDTLSEHELLGTVLAGVAMDDVVPESHLRGVLSDCARSLMTRCAPERHDANGHDRWAAWNLTGRTCLELSVLAPLPAAAMADVADPPSRIDLKASGGHRPMATTPPQGAARRPIGRITEG
jgi:hypothetical protein